MNRNSQKHYTDQEKRYIREVGSKRTRHELADELGRSVDSISRIANKLDVDLKRKQRKQRNQTPVSHSFFDNIDSKEKAYVLGYWVADGHIQTNERAHSTLYNVGFTSKDKEHLETIKNLLSSTHKVSEKSCGSYRLIIGSKTMANALKSLGYSSSKSSEAHYPDIPSDVNSHFIREVFDGDGCITRDNVKKSYGPSLAVHFNGTEKLLRGINEGLPVDLNIRECKNKNMWRMRGRSEPAETACKFMYQNSKGIRMTRKYERWVDYQNGEGFYA